VPLAKTKHSGSGTDSAVVAVCSVVVLEDQFTSPCPFYNLQVLEIFKDFSFCKLSVMYDHVTSMNSVTATVHDDAVKNILLTDVRY